MQKSSQNSVWAARFGYAGLVPQGLFLVMAWASEQSRWIAQAGAFAYAASIFSFIGGLWWARAMASPLPRPWHFGLAVAPSLITLACFMPWVWGLAWPGPYLAILGVLLALSPMVDRQFNQAEPLAPAWFSLRLRLSVPLGLATLLIALV